MHSAHSSEYSTDFIHKTLFFVLYSIEFILCVQTIIDPKTMFAHKTFMQNVLQCQNNNYLVE